MSQEEADKKLADTLAQLNEAQSQLETYLSSINTAKLRTEDANNDCQKALEYKKSLDDQCNSVAANIGYQQGVLDGLVSKTDKVSSDLKVIQDESVVANQTLEAVNNNIASAEDKLKELSELVANKQFSVDKEIEASNLAIKNENLNLSNQKIALQDEVDSLSSQTSSLGVGIESAKAILTDLSDKIKEAEDTLSTRLSSVDNAWASYNEIEAKISFAQSDLASINNEIIVKKSDLSSIDDKIKEAQGRLDAVLLRANTLLNREAELEDRKQEITEKYQKIGVPITFSW